MENLNYLLENMIFINSFGDFIYPTLFYVSWILGVFLLLVLLNFKVSLVGLVVIPAISLIIFPDIMADVIGKSIYLLTAYFILFKIIVFFLNKLFPSNKKIKLSRFQLSAEQLKEYKTIVSGLKQIDEESDYLNSLDLERRKDGKYSERSRKGKQTNARLMELKSATTALILKKYKIEAKLDRFTSYRHWKDLIDKSILNSMISSVFLTIIALYFLPQKIAVYYGYINILLFVVLVFILFWPSEFKAERAEVELNNIVHNYYLNDQKESTETIETS